MQQLCGKSLKPSSRGLFETVERLQLPVNMIGMSWIHITKRLNHVNLFPQIAMKEGIADIKLPKRPVELDSKR